MSLRFVETLKWQVCAHCIGAVLQGIQYGVSHKASAIYGYQFKTGQ